MAEPQVVVAPTAQLSAGVLVVVRALLDDAFDGDFSDDDWAHSLGGTHVLVHVDSALVGHGCVVPRRLHHAGRVLRAGYVEALAVDREHRRRGHATRVMDALEGEVRRSYELGALSASVDGAALYLSRGWQAWRGPTSVLTARRVVRTPDDDGGVYVLPLDAPLDVTGELTCEERAGDVW